MKIIAAFSLVLATAFVARAQDDFADTVRKHRSVRKKITAVCFSVLTAFAAIKANAISLDDIQLWAGSGTNRAALVVEWNSPELFNQTTVPAPVANKTMVWGYRFNGTATGTQMLDAILAADPRLYVMVNETYGTFVTGVGYNLNGNGVIGVTDGASTNYFTGGLLTNNDTSFADAAYPINNRDLYWGGYYGPYWQVFTESNDSGGFCDSPNRGSSQYWDPDTFNQGQWSFAQAGLDQLYLTNGSWIGFSVAAAGYDYTDPSDPANVIANDDGQAPPSPDGTYVAYVVDTNDFATEVVSTNNIDSSYPYNDPTAVLGPPTLRFVDIYDGDVTDRVTVIDPPYNLTPCGNDVITVIETGGELTVRMGHKIHANASHPYGVDFIVHGNSFFYDLSGPMGGFVSDETDLSAVTLTDNAYFGHQAVISVSQDGTNWVTLTNQPVVFPDEAYRWDDTNSSWTDERMNPTKPLNPSIYGCSFNGPTVAAVLDQFAGAGGGSGFSLQGTGLPWIQYVQIQTATDDYAVIDAIAAVNPVVVGDALSITPDDVASGNTNLFFQRADNYGCNQISIGFDSVNEVARINTVGLNDFCPFAPVPGNVSSAYQIQSLPLMETNPVAFSADVGLRAGDNYTGDGSDLRVFQWDCTNWISQPFDFDAANNEVTLSGVTNSSEDLAFVVSQIVLPVLTVQSVTNGYALAWTTVPNCPETLDRSTNLTAWSGICTFTATNAELITLTDTNAPAGAAFYRVQVNVP